MNRFVVCITGASGVIYGYRLIEELSKKGDVDVIVSSSGKLVIREELKKDIENLKKELPKVRFHDERDFLSPLASGSVLSKYKAVIVAPCSMSTLANVANGINQNLIHRVCEVALKERINLILLVREMPYSKVHIENMLRATEAGAVVMPASPGFYHNPKSLEDMINFVVGKILDLLKIEHSLYKRWKS